MRERIGEQMFYQTQWTSLMSLARELAAETGTTVWKVEEPRRCLMISMDEIYLLERLLKDLALQMRLRKEEKERAEFRKSAEELSRMISGMSREARVEWRARMRLNPELSWEDCKAWLAGKERK